MKHQMALIVKAFDDLYTDKNKSLDALNNLLKEGWRVVSNSQIGGGGVVSLVILEKECNRVEKNNSFKKSRS